MNKQLLAFSFSTPKADKRQKIGNNQKPVLSFKFSFRPSLYPIRRKKTTEAVTILFGSFLVQFEKIMSISSAMLDLVCHFDYNDPKLFPVNFILQDIVHVL